MKKNFELFIGNTGAAITYCNKAIMEHGDYKKIARINPYTGELKLFVEPTEIPGPVLLRIEHDADTIYANTHA